MPEKTRSRRSYRLAEIAVEIGDERGSSLFEARFYKKSNIRQFETAINFFAYSDSDPYINDRGF